jgi:hemoglobin
MAEPTLYERLSGIYAIAAVMDHFSDQPLRNPKGVEANPELKQRHTETSTGRLPGLKFLKTHLGRLVGGRIVPIHGPRAPRRSLRPEDPSWVLDEVDAELGRTVDHVDVPARREKSGRPSRGGRGE